MRNKRRKWVQYVIACVLMMTMLITMTAPISVQAAEGLYLAYQNTETGTPVVKLKGASAKAVYKVTELNMSKGDKVDLCFINAPLLWHNARWTSDNEKVATVNSAGVINAVGEGIAKITLTYDIRFSNAQESASITVYVGEDNWKIHIGTTANDIPESRELKIGRKMDLVFWGVSDWNGGKLFDFEWMSSDEKILSVDKSTGVITALSPGTAQIAIHIFNKVSNIAFYDIIEVKVLPMAFSDSTWNDENYLTYGENYFRLFSGDYMYRIPGSVIDKHVVKEYGRIAETPSDGTISEKYYNAISNINGLDRFLMGTLECLQNGTTIAVNAVLGGEDTYEEAKAYNCILRFVEELQKNENSISSIVADVAGTADTLNYIYTETVDFSKTEMMDILGESKYLTEIEIKEMVNELYKNADLIGDLVSDGVTIAEYIGSAVKLQEIDEAVIYSLSRCAGNDTPLSNGLDVLYEERSKTGVAALTEKYLSEKAADAINAIINAGTGGKADVIIKKVGELEEELHLDMDSYFAAVEFGAYQAELRFYCKELLKEINSKYNSYTEDELKKKIEEYEFAYEAYIAASKMMVEETLKIAKASDKSKIQACINILNRFDYNFAVDLAMKYFRMDNPTADEHELVKPVVKNEQESTSVTTDKNAKNKTQYGYYHYTNGNGEYSVCAYYGVSKKNWTNVYREEIWVDEPLTKAGSEYRHIRLEGCDSIGCLDPQWENGNKYVDANGIVWYCQKTRTVEKTTAENKNVTVIRDNDGVSEPIVSPESTTTQSPIAQASSVQDKLNYLLERLGATDGNIAYFTKNQKSCTTSFVYGHGNKCENCSNSNVVQEGWFKEIFGYADAGNFPKHTITKTGERNNRGYSCFGFASFAQWYLYADSCIENVKGKEIKAVKFNKDNMMSYAQPGDIVRVNNHSVVVYSVEEDGLWVVDCNWDKNNAGEKIKNCVVQKHFFEYSMSKYKDKMAYINRVEKVIDGENKVGQFDINNLPATQIPVLRAKEKNLSVQYFQQNLYYLGYTVGKFDGDYGNNTSTAVKNLQKDLKMEQTGEVNMYLYHLVNNSMKEIQQYLKEKGYYSSEIDGIAGSGTSKAITKLQTEWGMNATGRVTVALMQKIVEKKGASAVPNLAEYVKLSK